MAAVAGRKALGWISVLLAIAAGGPATAEKVDLELVLAVDVSGSMDPEEQAVQRNGYIEAITHPEVLAAIRSGPLRKIAVTYVEWAGSPSQAVIIPWKVVNDIESASAFVDALADVPTSRFRGTSISSALIFAAPLFDDNGFEGYRRVIDVSGDGPNNMGVPVEPVRDRVVASGIVINGLPILIRPSMGWSRDAPGLDDYYRDCVIGGMGAFVIPIATKEEFAPAIRKKLVLEISGLPPRLIFAAADAPRTKTDCMIGEAAWRVWDRQ